MFWAGATSLGCSGNVARGRSLYAGGYYVEAAEVFERNENNLAEWPPEKRAAYGLYRSMTLLELGDVSGAQRWLHYCQWVQGRTPGALSTREMELVAQTQAKVDARLRVDPGTPAVTDEAVAAQGGQTPGEVAGTAATLPPGPGSAPSAPGAQKTLVP